MLVCPGAFMTMQYMLAKATRYYHNWMAIRASYGMNGIFLHDDDMTTFRHYLLTHQGRRPPDHLAVEWFAGETKESGEYKNWGGKYRQHAAYRYNLFDHIGTSSTLRSAKQTSFPRCYAQLGEPTLFAVEAFNPRQCPRDDLWPCNVKHPEKAHFHTGPHQ